MPDKGIMKTLDIHHTLDLLNHHLKELGERRSFIICGGIDAALVLQNIVTRGTRDVVAPEIDSALRAASHKVAQELDLDPQWLNSDPKGLANDLAPGWRDRVVSVYSNIALDVFSISREDMVFAKFYAYCDRQQDIYDLISLNPTQTEVDRAAALTSTKDANPDWPPYVEEQRLKLIGRLKNE